MSPIVSIITPTYNPTFEEFIRSKNSIDAQTCKDFEWIVVDDGSTNYNGWAIARTEQNWGASVARNLAFQLSSGDIITYLDIGDVLYEDRVKTLIELFEKYKLQLIFSAYDIQQEGYDPVIYDHFNMIGKHPKFPTAFEYIQLLKKQNITIPLGVAHTRKPFVEVGGFQRGIVCGEDGILWRRMVNRIPNSEILFSDDRAGRYFISQTGQSRTQRRPSMGGFAFDGSKENNGSYLDLDWFKNFKTNEDLYDK